MASVWTFFYGSYMNFDVLAEVGTTPQEWELASLEGFELTIRPLANLHPSPGHTAWGIVALVTHAELERLYAHARDVLGGTYFPQAVLVQRLGAPPLGEPLRPASHVPAFCYLATDIEDAPAEAAYVERILRPARALGLPPAYLAHIASFAP